MKQFFMVFALLFAIVGAEAPVAAGEVDRALDERTVRKLDKWAKCYAKNRKSRAIISMYSFEPGYGAAVSRSGAHTCLRVNSGSFSASPVQMMGAVYAVLLRGLPRAEPLVPIDGPAYDGDKRNAEDKDNQKVVSSYFIAAECVVKRSPAGSYDFAVSKFISSGRNKVYGKLLSHWSACSPPSKTIQRITLQALLARTIVRMKGLEPKRKARDA